MGPALTHWEASPPHFLLHTASPQQAASSDTCFPIILIFPGPPPAHLGDVTSYHSHGVCLMLWGLLLSLSRIGVGNTVCPCHLWQPLLQPHSFQNASPDVWVKGHGGGSLSLLIPLTQGTGLPITEEVGDLREPGFSYSPRFFLSVLNWGPEASPRQ